MIVQNDKYFVAVAGNIGAGKSTLTGMLSEALGWEPFYEANAENPYLADFYQRYAAMELSFAGVLPGQTAGTSSPTAATSGQRDARPDGIRRCGNLRAAICTNKAICPNGIMMLIAGLYQAISAFLPPPDLIVYLARQCRNTGQPHQSARARIRAKYVGRLSGTAEPFI